MDIFCEPPHLPVGRLLFLKPESPFNEITDCLSGGSNFLRLEMIAEEIRSSFGFPRTLSDERFHSLIVNFHCP